MILGMVLLAFPLHNLPDLNKVGETQEISMWNLEH